MRSPPAELVTGAGVDARPGVGASVRGASVAGAGDPDSTLPLVGAGLGPGANSGADVAVVRVFLCVHTRIPPVDLRGTSS